MVIKSVPQLSTQLITCKNIIQPFQKTSRVPFQISIIPQNKARPKKTKNRKKKFLIFFL